jgi:L-asparagine transporter-like permease
MSKSMGICSGPLGILIYVVCGIIVFFSLRSAGVF